eukprot:6422871-Prymnesium_polylepis.2
MAVERAALPCQNSSSTLVWLQWHSKADGRARRARIPDKTEADENQIRGSSVFTLGVHAKTDAKWNAVMRPSALSARVTARHPPMRIS